MKIWLNSNEKTALLKAVARGYLDLDDAPELIERLQDGKNTFLELMKQLPNVEE